MRLGETTGFIGNGIMWCQTHAGVSIIFISCTSLLVMIPNILEEYFYVLSTAVNCSESDLPDLSTRRDVITTDWDNVTISFGTVVK